MPALQTTNYGEGAKEIIYAVDVSSEGWEEVLI